MIRDYTHIPTGKEIEAISGYYYIEKEDLLDYKGKKVLYAIGNGIIDSSCCGQGGCRYAVVPGYLISWKSRKDEQGRTISEVESVIDKTSRTEIRRLIEKTEFVTQVQFW